MNNASRNPEQPQGGIGYRRRPKDLFLYSLGDEKIGSPRMRPNSVRADTFIKNNALVLRSMQALERDNVRPETEEVTQYEMIGARNTGTALGQYIANVDLQHLGGNSHVNNLTDMTPQGVVSSNDITPSDTYAAQQLKNDFGKFSVRSGLTKRQVES